MTKENLKTKLKESTPINLSDANFSYTDLRFYDFRNVDLTHANFQGADLRFADFAGAKLRNANFQYAKLTGTIFFDNSK